MNSINMRKIKKIPAPDLPQSSEKKYFKSIPGVMLILHGICSIFIHILWTGIDAPYFSELKRGVFGFVFSALLMQGLCILIPSILVILFMKIPSDTIIGNSNSYTGNFFMAATVGVPAAVVFIGLNNGFVYLMSLANISLPRGSFASDASISGKYGFVISILVAVLLPGIIEELMFRGVIQGAMHAQGAKFSAVFFSAIAFALFHADPLFVVAPFLAGLLLGFMRYKSNSIYPPIITHISMNLTILIAAPLLPRLSSEYFSTMYTNTELYASLLAAALASTALIPMLIVFSASGWKKSSTRNTNIFFPFDYKYLLGLIILLSTLLFVYFSSIS